MQAPDSVVVKMDLLTEKKVESIVVKHLIKSSVSQMEHVLMKKELVESQISDVVLI